jgi:multidrug efflux pump subunit AcrB
LFLAGCFDAKSLGVGRRPYFPKVAPLIFTADEKNTLNSWRDQDKALFDRIVIQNNTRADMEKKYNEENVRVEKTRLKALGYEDDEISATIYAGLRKVGYLATDDLAKDYAPKADAK